MNNWTFSDQEARLFEMGGGFIAIWEGFVNIDDLINLRPGAIVRCRKDPREAIRIVDGTHDAIGCVAGWASEEA